MVSVGDVLSLIEVVRNLRSLRENIRQRQSDQLISKTSDRHVASLYEFLYEVYYDISLLEGPDGPFPIAVMPLSTAAKSNLDRLAVDIGPRPSHSVTHRDVVAALQRHGAKIWNGKTFCLSTLSVDDTGAVDGIKGYIGSYFDMINSADYLEFELLAAIHSGAPFALNDLPARQAAIQQSASPGNCLRRGGGVDAAIAVSTLIAYARGGEYWLLCDVRSKQVAVHSNLYHVIPSFMYQPVTASTDDNISLERGVIHNIFREYLEELFRVPEVDRVGRPVRADFFYGHPNLLFLRKLLDSGQATLEGVSLAFNLLNHRPEICTLLLIKDESWFNSQADMAVAKEQGLEWLNFNDEFLANEAQNHEFHPELITTLRITDNKWSEVARPWMMVPPGAPALILGSKLALARTGNNEPEWLRAFTVKGPRF